MKEHIEALEQLLDTPAGEAREPALRAAIELMRAAEPKDPAAEDTRCHAILRVSGLEYGYGHVDLLMREFAAVRAECYSEIEALSAANHKYADELSAAQAEVSNLKLSTMHLLRENEELATKLKNLRTAAERASKLGRAAWSEEERQLLRGAAIEASR